MTTKAAFYVFVKCFGLWLFVRGMQNFVSAMYSRFFSDWGFDLIGDYLVAATPQVLIGLFFLAQSELVCRVCRMGEPSDDS